LDAAADGGGGGGDLALGLGLGLGLGGGAALGGGAGFLYYRKRKGLRMPRFSTPANNTDVAMTNVSKAPKGGVMIPDPTSPSYSPNMHTSITMRSPPVQGSSVPQTQHYNNNYY
jgi:hypothetical protein